VKALLVIRTVATEAVLGPLQLFILVAAIFPVLVLGLLAYPIRHSLTDSIYGKFLAANRAMNEMRLRAAGDDREKNSNEGLPDPGS